MFIDSWRIQRRTFNYNILFYVHVWNAVNRNIKRRCKYNAVYYVICWIKHYCGYTNERNVSNLSKNERSRIGFELRTNRETEELCGGNKHTIIGGVLRLGWDRCLCVEVWKPRWIDRKWETERKMVSRGRPLKLDSIIIEVLNSIWNELNI